VESETEVPAGRLSYVGFIWVESSCYRHTVYVRACFDVRALGATVCVRVCAGCLV